MINESLRQKFLVLCTEHNCTEDEMISELIRYFVFLHENVGADQRAIRKAYLKVLGFEYKYASI